MKLGLFENGWRMGVVQIPGNSFVNSWEKDSSPHHPSIWNNYCRLSRLLVYSRALQYMAGVGKLFTRRATFEKILKARAALIERVKRKKGLHVLRCPVF